MKFDYSRIPQELKALKRWVLWKTKTDEKERTTKIPIDTRNGYGAKVNDSSTWSSFDEALRMCDMRGCIGLGFVLGSGYFGIDLDNHADDKGVYPMTEEQFRAFSEEFLTTMDSYSEISQSGKGIHIIAKGVLPRGRRKKGCVEMYDDVRFLAMTGDVYEDYDKLTEGTEKVIPLFNKYINNATKSNGGNAPEGGNEQAKYIYKSQSNTAHRTSGVGGILSDDEVIRKAQESSNGTLFSCLYRGQWEGLNYPSQSEADMAFCNLLAFWCGKDTAQMDRIFRTSGLYRDKWNEFRGEDTYGNATLKGAVENCRDTYNPSFTSEDSYNPRTGKVVYKKAYSLDDTGNARRFYDRFGKDLHYNFDNKYWVVWDGKTWLKDVKQIVKIDADIMIDEMREEMKAEENEELKKAMQKNIKHLASSSGKEAMLKEAQHLGTIPTINADYDKNIWLLNCANCVVNLKTGERMGHDKGLMMSKNTNVEVGETSTPALWMKYLHDVFDNDEDLINYVHKAIGYTLTGDVSEQVLFQCFGDGGSGKSVFMDIIYELLGDYGKNIQVNTIIAKNSTSNGANSDIARLTGARYVRTNEPDDGNRFSEGLVKQLVGGDVTTARHLYGNEFDFKPMFKLWIATNYKISVRGTDGGIWRRMRVIPFLHSFMANPDKHITDKIRKELPQILAWAIEGTAKWLKEGLEPPQAVQSAVEEYKKENDVIAMFLADATHKAPQMRIRSSDLYKAYAKWCSIGKDHQMSKTMFGREVAKKLNKVRLNGCFYFEDVELEMDYKEVYYV